MQGKMGKILTLSASSISSFQTCRKRYEYEKILKIFPVERPSMLDFGTAVHRGLERIFRGIKEYQETDPRPDFPDFCSHVLDDAILGIRAVDLQEQDRIKAEVLVSMYADRYFPGDALFENIRVLDVEHVMRQPVIDPDGRRARRYRCTGIADAVVECTDGVTAVMEHKTVSALTEQYCSRVEIDLQVLMYCYMLSMELGKPVRRVIYDIIVKPRHEMAVGETDEEFEARKAAAKCPDRCRRKEAETADGFRKRLEEAVTDASFMRHVVDIDGETMEDFRKDFWEMVHDMGTCRRFYRQTCSCMKFGACPYLDLCRNHGRTDGLDGQYMTDKGERP